jgi:hypothetical protein
MRKTEYGLSIITMLFSLASEIMSLLTFLSLANIIQLISDISEVLTAWRFASPVINTMFSFSTVRTSLIRSDAKAYSIEVKSFSSQHLTRPSIRSFISLIFICLLTSTLKNKVWCLLLMAQRYLFLCENNNNVNKITELKLIINNEVKSLNHNLMNDSLFKAQITSSPLPQK